MNFYPSMCCKVTKPDVKNIVIHFKFNDRKRKYIKRLRIYVEGKKGEKHHRQNHGNFICVKENGVSFTIFPHSGNVIATGIKERSSILPIVKKFLATIKLNKTLSCLSILRITNSTYSGSIVCSSLDNEHLTVSEALSYFIENVDKNDIILNEWDVSFRSQFFPGIRIRHINGGTINLFNNGKFVLVGVKSRKRVRHLTNQLCVFMKKCWMTLDEETSCVWSVDS